MFPPELEEDPATTPSSSLRSPPSTDVRSSVDSRPSSIATSALKRINRGMSSASFVLNIVGTRPFPDAPLGIDGRRSTVPFGPGRANPDPIPLPSCQPVTPVAMTDPLPWDAASPGLLPLVEPARPEVDRPRDWPGRTVNWDFASTQISHPMCR